MYFSTKAKFHSPMVITIEVHCTCSTPVFFICSFVLLFRFPRWSLPWEWCVSAIWPSRTSCKTLTCVCLLVLRSYFTLSPHIRSQFPAKLQQRRLHFFFVSFVQLLLKEYEEEIKALRMELAMHDTLVRNQLNKALRKDLSFLSCVLLWRWASQLHPTSLSPKWTYRISTTRSSSTWTKLSQN